jgi:hypothetical protein
VERPSSEKQNLYFCQYLSGTFCETFYAGEPWNIYLRKTVKEEEYEIEDVMDGKMYHITERE